MRNSGAIVKKSRQDLFVLNFGSIQTMMEKEVTGKQVEIALVLILEEKERKFLFLVLKQMVKVLSKSMA